MRKGVLVICVGVIFVLIVSELGLRVYFAAAYGSGLRNLPAQFVPATVRANESYPRILVEGHPFLPFMLRRATHVWMNPMGDPPGQGADHRVDYRINSLGGRGDEVAAQKPPGSIRIVALGGSTTFGVHVQEEHSWPSVLGRLLNDQSGGSPRYEVLNFGTPMASSPYTLVALATKVIHLRPDIVVVYDGVNDISNWRFPGLRPDHSHVFEDMRAIPGWVEWVPAWGFRSALVAAAVHALALRQDRGIGIRTDLPPPGPIDHESGIPNLLDNYRSMRAIADAHGARFVTATLHLMSEEDEWGRAVVEFNRRLDEWGAAENIPVVPLAARIPHGEATIHTDGAHFTAKGERLVAELIAERLARHVLPDIVLDRAR
jgi:lysophospholipase L1-like esterase